MCARTPAPIVVVGAGLAGLRTAELLHQAGRSVVVLEARREAGGRVRTIRTPLDEDLYGEAGAIRIPDMHRRVRDTAGRLGLNLIPFESGNGAPLLRVAGRTVRLPDDIRGFASALSLRRDEIGLNPRGLLLKYVGELPPGMDDPSLSPDRYQDWISIDRQTWPAWLASRGASEGAIRVMTAGGDSRELSALYVLRQYGLLRDVKQYFKIDGGMEQLPRRLAEGVSSVIRYDAAVVSLEQQPDRVNVEYAEGETRRTIQASRVVVTIPFATLREVSIRPALPGAKATAVTSLPYFPATRVLIQTKTRFWHAEGLSATSRSDQPAETWDAAYDQPADRGLLAMTVGGTLGRELAGAGPERGIVRSVELATETFPRLRDAFDKGVVCAWAAERWSRGAFAVFHPGQMSILTADIARPEGRIHFAGEHTSPWMGWMEGALESAERVANEVLSA
jgi:monoamine oxidase